MAPFAPWIHAPNVLGALSAGARVGIESAQLQQQGQEAGDRLRLAYRQLAANEEESARRAAQQQQLAAANIAFRAQVAQMQHEQGLASLDLRAKQLDATAAWHQNQAANALRSIGLGEKRLALSQERLKHREDVDKEMSDIRSAGLDLRRQMDEWKMKTAAEKPTEFETINTIDPDTGRVVRSVRRPVTATEQKTLTKELARDFLSQAGGDKEKARQLARDAGYTF